MPRDFTTGLRSHPSNIMRPMYSISTRIAAGGFKIFFESSANCKADVDYFIVGSGGRESTGSAALNGPGEKFVRTDFSALAVGITDVRIEEAETGERSRGDVREHGNPIPAAILGIICSSILSSHEVSATNPANKSPEWRDLSAQFQSPPYFATTGERFVASG